MRKRLRTAVRSSRFRWIASALTLGLVILAAVVGLGLPDCVSRFAIADTTIGHAATDSSSATSALEQRSLRRVKVESVASSTEVELACYPGTTKAGEDSALAFRVSGPLVELNVKPGDRVSRGDVLMQIDPRDFKLAVKAAQATLDSAQAKLSAMQQGARVEDIRVLEANMAAAEARCDFLQSNQVRYTKLLRDNAISPCGNFRARMSATIGATASVFYVLSSPNRWLARRG